MGADEAVGAEATDEEAPGQQPEVARAEPEGEAGEWSAGRGARRPRPDRPVGLAEGAKPDVTRIVAHQQRHERENHERNAGDQ